MPWAIKPSDDRCPAGKRWAVVNEQTNRLVGCHPNRKSALAQQRALYANVPESRKSMSDVTQAAEQLASQTTSGCGCCADCKCATSKDAMPNGQFTGLTQDDTDDSYVHDNDLVPSCPRCGTKCSKCMGDYGMADATGGDVTSKAAGKTPVVKLGVKTKSMPATIQPVDNDGDEFPGRFRLILSKDNTDRDGDNLWAYQWQHPLPPKLHMDSDHAWARHESVPLTVGSGTPSIDGNGNLVVDGTYASSPHAQLTRGHVNEGHIWQASVSYMDHQLPDGSVERELLNGTFTGVPANPEAVITHSASLASKGTKMTQTVTSKDDGDMGMDDLVDAEHKKTGGTTEGQYPPDKGPFGDPKNRKWPLNDRAHVLNAWSRIHQSHATVNYSAAQVEEIKGRIRSRARELGITLSEDKAMAALVDGLNALVKMKDVLAPWVMTQSNPGHTESGQDVGAVSVYDNDDDHNGKTDPDEDDTEETEGGVGGQDEDGNVLEWGDVHQSLAQACHDMACTIRDAAIQLGAQTKPDIPTINQSPANNGQPQNWEYEGWGDKALKAIEDGDIDAAKELVQGYIKHKTGMPTGPYQGVEGMSGENASGTNPGTSITDGELFLQGTAGPAIVPSSKTLPSSTDDKDADASSSKDASASVSPADVAARARLRKFKLDNAILETEAS